MLATDTIGSHGEHPPDSCADPPHQGLAAACHETRMRAQEVCIGPYSVDDYRFVQQAAMEVAKRVQAAGTRLPERLHDRLGLNGHEEANDIFASLMAIPDLQERRRALCDVIHVITSHPHS